MSTINTPRNHRKLAGSVIYTYLRKWKTAFSSVEKSVEDMEVIMVRTCIERSEKPFLPCMEEGMYLTVRVRVKRKGRKDTGTQEEVWSDLSSFETKRHFPYSSMFEWTWSGREFWSTDPFSRVGVGSNCTTTSTATYDTSTSLLCLFLLAIFAFSTTLSDL